MRNTAAPLLTTLFPAQSKRGGPIQSLDHEVGANTIFRQYFPEDNSTNRILYSGNSKKLGQLRFYPHYNKMELLPLGTNVFDQFNDCLFSRMQNCDTKTFSSIRFIVQRAETDDLYGAAVDPLTGQLLDENVQGEVQHQLDVLCNTYMLRAFCGGSDGAIGPVASELT